MLSKWDTTTKERTTSRRSIYVVKNQQRRQVWGYFLPRGGEHARAKAWKKDRTLTILSLSLDSFINHERRSRRFSTSRIFSSPSVRVHPEEKVYTVKFNRSRGKYERFSLSFFIVFEIERCEKLPSIEFSFASFLLLLFPEKSKRCKIAMERRENLWT